MLYGALHSWLASLWMKRRARHMFGTHADRWFRLAYNLIAVLTFLPVLALPVLLPDHRLYRIPTPWSFLAAAGQVLAAVTEEDEANLVITSLAKFEFNVPRVIARVNNPKNAWLFNSEMGVDVALNQADILATLIAEEMSLGDMMTLL